MSPTIPRVRTGRWDSVSEMDTSGGCAVEQPALERLIRSSLAHDEVALAYQPVFDLATDSLVGVEALLRVKDASGAAVPALTVVEAAEHSGLIDDLGWRVLELAIAQCASWLDELGVLVPVAVNVSAAQLESPVFASQMQAAIAAAGIPPGVISIELTETVLLDKAGATAQLRELGSAGVDLAIDDFGTGYSSLTYLYRLPATSVKIDRSFVAGLPEDRKAVAIVSGVVALAQSCGIACVAEGIETEAQRSHLRDLKILGQGYLLGMPADAAAIDDLVRAGRLETHAAHHERVASIRR